MVTDLQETSGISSPISWVWSPRACSLTERISDSSRTEMVLGARGASLASSCARCSLAPPTLEIPFACFSSFLVGGHKRTIHQPAMLRIFLIGIFVGLRRFAVFGQDGLHFNLGGVWISGPFGVKTRCSCSRLTNRWADRWTRPPHQLIDGLLFWGGASEGDAVNVGKLTGRSKRMVTEPAGQFRCRHQPSVGVRIERTCRFFSAS